MGATPWLRINLFWGEHPVVFPWGFPKFEVGLIIAALAGYMASMIESFTQGLGTAAFLSLLMNLCDKEHAATQYAILSALFALTRDVAGAFTGIGVEHLGYAVFFAITTALALPGLALLPLIKPRIREDAAGSPVDGE